MITLKPFKTLKAIREAFNLKGIFETTQNNKLNFCSHEDDAVIVQIGWVTSEGFDIDAELAKKASDVHTKLTRYFEGGCHEGISMLVLNLDSSNKEYIIYGDDTDGDCEPVEVKSNTFADLIEAIDKLVQQGSSM
jgi:hypothetical protein